MLARKLAENRKHNNKEDPFKKIQFESLQDMAIKIVAQNYELYPELKGLSEPIRSKIISLIKTDYPIQYTAPYIDYESFWERSCHEQFQNQIIKLENHGMSWKQAYLEKHIEQYLQKYEPNEDSIEQDTPNNDLIEELKYSRNWIMSLDLKYMSSTLDLVCIAEHLPLLQNLSLRYTLQKKSINIANFKQIGIKLNEADILGKSLKRTQNLLSLRLTDNLVDDDIMKFLVEGLNMNISLMHLDLSHNRISNEGARRIAKFLMRNEMLIELNLSDNLIAMQGTIFLGHSLKFNTNLQILNLKLNRICDMSGERFFRDIQNNKTLSQLDMSSNGLSTMTAEKISDLISNPLCTLKQLDVSANNFTDKSYDMLQLAFNKNVSLIKCDIRNSEFEQPKFEGSLMETIVKHKLNNIQKIPFVGKDDFVDLKAKLQKQKQEKKKEKQAEEEKKENI